MARDRSRSIVRHEGDELAPFGVVEVCERHQTEKPGKCEDLVYKARGELARRVLSNERCTVCDRPLARIADRVGELLEQGRDGIAVRACDFCGELGIDLARGKRGMLGVHMHICEPCASDAARALRAMRQR